MVKWKYGNRFPETGFRERLIGFERKGIMTKKLGVVLLVCLLMMSLTGVSFALVNDNDKGKGQENAATPAVPADPHGGGTPATPAQPAVPAHKQVDESNILSNPYLTEVLSENEPDGQGAVDTQDSWIFFTNSGAEASFELDKKNS